VLFTKLNLITNYNQYGSFLGWVDAYKERKGGTCRYGTGGTINGNSETNMGTAQGTT
jgi:hypothetical protein